MSGDDIVNTCLWVLASPFLIYIFYYLYIEEMYILFLLFAFGLCAGPIGIIHNFITKKKYVVNNDR